jgi:hypothetical protein
MYSVLSYLFGKKQWAKIRVTDILGPDIIRAEVLYDPKWKGESLLKVRLRGAHASSPGTPEDDNTRKTLSLMLLNEVVWIRNLKTDDRTVGGWTATCYKYIDDPVLPKINLVKYMKTHGMYKKEKSVKMKSKGGFTALPSEVPPTYNAL